MKTIYPPLIAMTAGMLLLALSAAWPHITGRPDWTDRQARPLAQAAADVHRLSYSHGPAEDHPHQTDREDQADQLAAAKQRYERSNTMLQRARSHPARIARFLKWTGILCSLLGIGGYFRLRSVSG